MKRHIFIFTFLLGAFAALGLSAFAASSGSDVMRLSPIGYRLGASGAVTAYDSSVVTVTPGDTSIVSSNKPVTLTATLNRDYKVVCWQKFDVDPTIRTTADPIEEFGEGSGIVSVNFNPNVQWMYVTVVVRYDPVRTVKASLSSFATGTVTVSPEKSSYLKGDVVTLTASPAGGYDFVRWSDGNIDHERMLTVDGDVDLKAYIEPISSKVTFGVESDAVLDVTSKRVSYGCEYGELPTPTRRGYDFKGWIDDTDLVVKGGTKVTALKDHTLKARWAAKIYSITCVSNPEGAGDFSGIGSYAYGTEHDLRAYQAEGFVFAGWGDGETANPRKILVVGDAVYTANFNVATNEVTFLYHSKGDAEGSDYSQTNRQYVGYGQAANEPDPDDVTNWTGHVFMDWSTWEFTNVTRKLVVKALYDTLEQTHEVRFTYRNQNGESVTNDPERVVHGKDANPPEDRDVNKWMGHVFTGWKPDYTNITADCVIEAQYGKTEKGKKFSTCLDVDPEDPNLYCFPEDGMREPDDYECTTGGKPNIRLHSDATIYVEVAKLGKVAFHCEQALSVMINDKVCDVKENECEYEVGVADNQFLKIKITRIDTKTDVILAKLRFE